MVYCVFLWSYPDKDKKKNLNHQSTANQGELADTKFSASVRNQCDFFGRTGFDTGVVADVKTVSAGPWQNSGIAAGKFP